MEFNKIICVYAGIPKINPWHIVYSSIDYRKVSYVLTSFMGNVVTLRNNSPFGHHEREAVSFARTYDIKLFQGPVLKFNTLGLPPIQELITYKSRLNKMEVYDHYTGKYVYVDYPMDILALKHMNKFPINTVTIRDISISPSLPCIRRMRVQDNITDYASLQDIRELILEDVKNVDYGKLPSSIPYLTIVGGHDINNEQRNKLYNTSQLNLYYLRTTNLNAVMIHPSVRILVSYKQSSLEYRYKDFIPNLEKIVYTREGVNRIMNNVHVIYTGHTREEKIKGSGLVVKPLILITITCRLPNGIVLLSSI